MGAAEGCDLFQAKKIPEPVGDFLCSINQPESGLIFAVATQLQLLSSNASVLQFGQEFFQTIFRQFDEAEAVTYLDATDCFASQATLVEDSAQQVLGSDTITRTQRGTATSTTFSQWNRSTTLTITTVRTITGTLWTIATWCIVRHQWTFFLDRSQGQRLSVGGLAQQSSSQCTRSATDVSGQAIQQITVSRFGISNQRRQAVGQFLDASIENSLGVRQASSPKPLPNWPKPNG